MTAPPGFDRLLSPSQGPADVLALTDPEPLTRAGPPAAAAWRLYSGAVSLRRAGRASEAKPWFNTEAAVIPLLTRSGNTDRPCEPDPL